MKHKEWLDNEYKLWVEALERATVNNFKEHSHVKRMLGEVDRDLFYNLIIDGLIKRGTIIDDIRQQGDLLFKIDNIGYSEPNETISGNASRMIYYALQVLEINPKSICEIGGGVGQFYAVLRALGYTGNYFIMDLPEVQKFQRKYLAEVANLTGLKLPLVTNGSYEMCVSFYALGEFDNELKDWYIENVINHCPRGFIIWSAHSGASNEINFKHKLLIQPENPLTLKGNLQITW